MPRNGGGNNGARNGHASDPSVLSSMQQRYGIELRGGDHNALIGREDALLTAGQVRGFEAQAEIRRSRQEGAPDSVFTLHPRNSALNRTNEALHSYLDQNRSKNDTANNRRAGAAMQGHGLVHTPSRPGEVLLGSRGSHSYQNLAESDRKLRTANVRDWSIQRNDDFMAGALLGPNTFSLPRQNASRDYIHRGRPLPGRVTAREISQLQKLGHYDASPDNQPTDRFRVGSSTNAPHAPAPDTLRSDLERHGEQAQHDPDPVFQSVPSDPIPRSQGHGGGGGGGRGGGGRGGGGRGGGGRGGRGRGRGRN